MRSQCGNNRGCTCAISATLLVLWAFAIYPLPRAVYAQTPANTDSHTAAIHTGDSLHDAFNVLGALAVFDSALSVDENNVEILWRATRECVMQGLLVDGTDLQNSWFVRGEEYAQRAAELEQNNLTVMYWLLAAKGRRAVQTDALTTARLATEVHTLAHAILRADSLHPGATHALGVLNFEVMKLTRIKRFIGQRILGSRAFDGTSWENAESFLARATELEPENALFWLDLGKLRILREEFDRAREALRQVLLLGDHEPTDGKFKTKARQLLSELDQR